jgi:hypothetical protein
MLFRFGRDGPRDAERLHRGHELDGVRQLSLRATTIRRYEYQPSAPLVKVDRDGRATTWNSMCRKVRVERAGRGEPAGVFGALEPHAATLRGGTVGQ